MCWLGQGVSTQNEPTPTWVWKESWYDLDPKKDLAKPITGHACEFNAVKSLTLPG